MKNEDIKKTREESWDSSRWRQRWRAKPGGQETVITLLHN